MKKSLSLLTLAAAGVFTLNTLAVAEDAKPASPGGPGGRMTPEERLKMMTEKLGLTQEQQDKIKAIFEKGAPERKELMAKGRENLTEEDKTKLREMMKSQMEDVAAVLTPEQKEKWKAEREAHGGPGARAGGAKAGAK